MGMQNSKVSTADEINGRDNANNELISEIARNVLALRKMNWNSSQFNVAMPIRIRAASQVGRIMKHVPIGQKESSEYPCSL